jgi:hypothetical protein
LATKHPQPKAKKMTSPGNERSPLSRSATGGFNVMEGFLIKEGGAIKTWKKRWCILNDGILAYQTKKVCPYARLIIVGAEMINLCLVPTRAPP